MRCLYCNTWKELIVSIPNPQGLIINQFVIYNASNNNYFIKMNLSLNSGHWIQMV